jgi:hypothetical protein
MMVSVADPSCQKLGQHGAVCQVPDWCRRHELVSVARDPFDRCRSLYDFRWWQTYPGIPQALLRERFPTFPDLSFDQVHELAMLEKEGHTPGVAAGYQTIYFIRMFARDPNRVLARLGDDYISSGRWREDFPPIRFLPIEELNTALPAYLQDRGFSADDVAFIQGAPRENVSVRCGNWTPELLARVAHDERYLFQMLAQRGFEYAPPEVRHAA